MYRWIQLTLLAIVLTALNAQETSIPGVKVQQSSLTRTFVPGTCGTGALSVCSSCSTQSLCIAPNVVVDIACNGTANPYCVTNGLEASCSTTPATGCTPPADESASISCSSVGLLPDPLNCNIYHACITVQSLSNVYVCPTGTRFNLAVLQCRTQNLSPCVTINCNGTSGFVYYGSSQQYYAYCSLVNGVTTPYMFKCPNRATFSMATRSCVYVCPGQGNYANTNNPATYYQCYIANGRYVAALMECPQGTTFSQTLQYCS